MSRAAQRATISLPQTLQQSHQVHADNTNDHRVANTLKHSFSILYVRYCTDCMHASKTTRKPFRTHNTHTQRESHVFSIYSSMCLLVDSLSRCFRPHHSFLPRQRSLNQNGENNTMCRKAAPHLRPPIADAWCTPRRQVPQHLPQPL